MNLEIATAKHKLVQHIKLIIGNYRREIERVSRCLFFRLARD